jgi:hypothetical protein
MISSSATVSITNAGPAVVGLNSGLSVSALQSAHLKPPKMCAPAVMLLKARNVQESAPSTRSSVRPSRLLRPYCPNRTRRQSSAMAGTRIAGSKGCELISEGSGVVPPE